MRDSQTFDVIAVGSGPGGAVAAKRCASERCLTESRMRQAVA